MHFTVKFKVGLFYRQGELVFFSGGTAGRFYLYQHKSYDLLRDKDKGGNIYFNMSGKKIYLHDMRCMSIPEFNKALNACGCTLLHTPPRLSDELAITMIGHGLENIRFAVTTVNDILTPPMICKLDLSDDIRVRGIMGSSEYIGLVPVDENTIPNPKYFTKSELVELLRNGSISLLETAGNSNTVSQNIDEYFNTWFKRLNTVQW